MTTPNFPLQLKDPSLLRTQAYINGAWVDAVDSSTFSVDNPANGQIIAQVANVTADQTEAAIAAAEQAMVQWRQRTGKDRANLMRKWFDLMIENTDDLARLMTLEQGKPVAEAKGEVAYASSFIEWFAEEAKRVSGEMPASPVANNRMMVMRQPIGVCAAITPWNFPLAMITRKAGPALAAGCTMVLKPAEQTPLSALAMAVLAERAGIPAGVLNVVPADGERSIAVGKKLCESPVVRKLSFTGSTQVGRILMRQSADTIKKLSLELGGQAPFIVFDDADLDAAVEGAIASKYRNAGQTCVCSNRFYVQDAIYDAFVEKLAERSRELPVGDGFTEGVLQGPLIDDDAVAKVEEHIKDAVAKGARIVTGGQRDSHGARFFQPTVLADANSDMLCMHEETFGPVAPVERFSTEAEAIALANSVEVGLASYFYSRDVNRIFRVSEALEYGMVGVNTGLISNEVAPFGGVKLSGLGREGSVHGIEEYLEMKYVCLGSIDR